MKLASEDDVDWSKGLVPAIVQDSADGRVLMLGWMNRDALARTLAEREVVFFSRSRNELWKKGETSGHRLDVVDVSIDCDRDTLLVRATPRGPVCHTGAVTCFEARPLAFEKLAFLSTLEAVVDDRIAHPRDGSYTAKLVAEGALRVAQKVGEEGVEVALAGAARDDEALVAESADLVFHLLVLLRSRGIGLARVIDELVRRHP